MLNHTKRASLAWIGVGGRGTGLLKLCLKMPDVAVPALCDIDDRALKRAQDIVEDSGRARPQGYADHRQLLEREDIGAAIIATPWRLHTRIAIDTMEAGKYAAPEVYGATSLRECWDLVRASERTGMPCMMLENCCYGRRELAALRMVRQGVFGELVHCQCGYEHDLRARMPRGKDPAEGPDYRSRQNAGRNADLYPTHGIGPIARCLKINRGNRFMTLTSTASKARGIRDWVVRNLGEDHPAAETQWALGDMVTSVIKCSGGETVVVMHSVTLPRPYSRDYRLQGTRGVWVADRDDGVVHIEDRSPHHEWEPFERYVEEYESPLWERYLERGKQEGHGGIDFLIMRALVSSVKNGQPTPIDVYDTATWMAITALSEDSIARGSAPVSFPDFTSGDWMHRNPPGEDPDPAILPEVEPS